MTNLLRISEAASLAMHAGVVLAANPGRSLSATTMATLLGASGAHLSKVLQDLARARLVQSARGPKGGFTLAEPADQVSLLDIFEAIDGPIQRGSCVSLHRAKFCLGDGCILGDLIGAITEQARERLAGTSLRALAEAFVAAKLESTQK